MSDKKDMNDYLNKLKQREFRGHKYTVSRSGGHRQVRWNGQLVTVAGSSPNGGRRALDNLRSYVARFEREIADASQDQGDRSGGQPARARGAAARA